MKASLFYTLMALSLGCSSIQALDLKSNDVDYQVGDQVNQGWRIYDADLVGKRPAVLIIHQWTGISEHEKSKARELAELGFYAFAADIFGKDVRPQPPESGKIAGKYKQDRALFRRQLLGALEEMKKDPLVDANNIAVIGYCFGGTGALEVARSGSKVNGVVSFHGSLDTPTPEDAKNIHGPLLVLHGADDPFVPKADIEAFKKEMDSAGADYTFVAYPGAVHSFTQLSAGNDPSKGAAYQKEADEKSWASMLEFFKRIFQ